MSREQENAVSCEQQIIKLATKQTSTEAWTAAVEAQLMINSKPKMGDAKQEGEAPKQPTWWQNRGILQVLTTNRVENGSSPDDS